MTTSEKVAYLKGLCEGLKLDTESDEGKLFTVIIDILEDIAADLEDLDEIAMDLDEDMEELSENISLLEDIVFEDEYDEYEDEDEDEDCSCCDGHGEPLFFEVKCPVCSDEITVDEDVLELGSISCPNCGERLEFDLDFEDDDDEDED